MSLSLQKCDHVSKRLHRKGFLFTLDALLAAMIIIGGLLLLGTLQEYHSDTTQLTASSQDVMQSLSSMRIGDVKNIWVQNQIANHSINDTNITVIEQIGQYWAEGSINNSKILSQIMLNGTYSDYGVILRIGGDILYASNNSTKTGDDTTVSSRMITGIAQGQATTGSSSSAYLRHIKNKRNALFIPFGGFVGEGNISVLADTLPSDAIVTDIIIELDTEQDFLFFVNGQLCDTLMPNSTTLVPSVWRANCSGLVNTSLQNKFSFKSNGSLDSSVIAGGYLKVLYTTDQLNDFYSSSTVYRFPEIDGLVNLYDGFSVPGTINSMNITLNFYSEYATYLTIGNASFAFAGKNVTQNITLNNTQIQAALGGVGLSYSNLSRNTVPLRFGIGNVVINGNPADVMVVTDTSGSMDWCITTDNPTPCPPGDTTKIISAKNVTTRFVTMLLNGTTGMNVGLSEFATAMKSWNNLTTNLTVLTSRISAYTATGNTCICCGINNATDALVLDGQLLLVQRGSSGWKYNDTNMALPSTWNSTNITAYNDSKWKDGTTNIGWSYAGQSTTIAVANRYQGPYYFRKFFNVSDASQIVESKLFVFSDDGADVYLNGVRVDTNYASSIANGVYWNRDSIAVNKSLFRNGTNLIAVRQYHKSNPDKMGFDMSLVANTKGNASSAQRKNIVIMSDGDANQLCSRQGTGDAKQDAIKAACDAYNNYGIITYTVGFGMGADNATMIAIANCTTGQYFSAKNDTALQLAFDTIGNTIIQSSSTQTAIMSGNVSRTFLSYNSTIAANYSPDVIPPQPNEISVTLQTPPLQSCSAIVPLYSGTRFLNAKIYSYSGDYWTSRVVMNGISAYNLSTYSPLYTSLGDPYQFNIPTQLLNSGNNTVSVGIAIDGYNTTVNCSANNTIVYTIGINLSTERSRVVPNSVGCNWTIQFPDGSLSQKSIPSSYNGSNICAYRQHIEYYNITNISNVINITISTNLSNLTPGLIFITNITRNITYDENDSYQLGAFTMFDRLDFKKDGTLFVDLNADDLEVIVTTVSKIPYLWGPSIVTVEVTR